MIPSNPKWRASVQLSATPARFFGLGPMWMVLAWMVLARMVLAWRVLAWRVLAWRVLA